MLLQIRSPLLHGNDWLFCAAMIYGFYAWIYSMKASPLLGHPALTSPKTNPRRLLIPLWVIRLKASTSMYFDRLASRPIEVEVLNGINRKDGISSMVFPTLDQPNTAVIIAVN